MKQALRRFISSSLVWQVGGLWRRGGCVVLTYHRVGANRYGFKHLSADLFRQQMRWLVEHCTVVSPLELRDACYRQTRLKPSVLVTFDDGYRDYHDVAYPILHELRVPAINFISTHFADHGELFWWDVVDLAVWSSTRQRAQLPWSPVRNVRLDAQGKELLRTEARRHIKSRPHSERETTLDLLCDALGVRRTSLTVDRQVMTWDEIRAVTGVTTIGGHTHTHPLLSRVDEAHLRDEIKVCRDRIAAELGAAPRTFAYPGGVFTDDAKRLLADNGFDTAFSSIKGVNIGGADWLLVKRVHAPRAHHQLPVLLGRLWARSQAEQLVG